MCKQNDKCQLVFNIKAYHLFKNTNVFFPRYIIWVFCPLLCRSVMPPYPKLKVPKLFIISDRARRWSGPIVRIWWRPNCILCLRKKWPKPDENKTQRIEHFKSVVDACVLCNITGNLRRPVIHRPRNLAKCCVDWMLRAKHLARRWWISIGSSMCCLRHQQPIKCVIFAGEVPDNTSQMEMILLMFGVLGMLLGWCLDYRVVCVNKFWRVFRTARSARKIASSRDRQIAKIWLWRSNTCVRLTMAYY